jgi:hypothetical protein
LRPPRDEPEPPPPANVPWYKKIWLWITGGSAGIGTFAWITDPWAWAKLFAVLIGCSAAVALLALAVAVAIFGRRKTADYLRQWLPRKEKAP